MNTEKSEQIRRRFHDWKETVFDADVDRPSEIAGFSTRELVSLAKSIELLAHGSGRPGFVNLEGKVDAACKLYPLLEQAAQGVPITAETVRPYRKQIKEIDLNAGCASTALGCLSIFPPLWLATVPATIKLNETIEKGFVERLPLVIAQTQEQFGKAWPIVKDMSQFDNPRGQFLDEMSWFLHELQGQITSRYDQLSDAHIDSSQFSLPHTRIAGDSIYTVLCDTWSSYKDKPFLSTILAYTHTGPRLWEIRDHLPYAAPEIVDGLGLNMYMPDGKRYRDVLYENADPMRIIAADKLDYLQRGLSGGIRALTALLPTDGDQMRTVFTAEAKKFGIEFEE
ncbi:MAG: hypothetical protein NUV98_03740 [Candidatus Roizmanbacteria bacterium]|nr:hypothetical protein [Candidatus Roizmanbacteria bacterium]